MIVIKSDRIFDTPQMKAIAILWLGFLRKKDANDDCYEIFTKLFKE
ncbi:MAG: hypothetical protein RMY36_000135 [Nostoc sp. SerVER01]|nr:hypothetical protein [Nostoc sp. DedQUE11]MDZ8082091.1 hypothetical protein [Nostoc sp. DcaGUA01]